MRIPSFNEFSIQTITKTIIGVMIAATMIFGIISAVTNNFIDNTEASWLEFKHSNAPHAKALAYVVGPIGYGGMIHQFKNYIIRQDGGRIEKVLLSATVALSALDEIELQDSTPETLEATAKIRSVIKAYISNSNMLVGLVNSGSTAKQIDTLLSINDTPAIEGLETLFAHLRQEVAGAPLSKNYYLGQLRRAMGFNGMIHHYKNYIIRHDAPRVEKVTAAMEAAKSALASYQEMGVSELEQSAIDDILSVLANYERGLQQAHDMIAAGASVTDIDHAIKVDDGPALEGISHLLKAISLQTDNASAIVSNDLAFVKKINLAVSIIIAIVAVLLSILMYRALNHGIAQPAIKIADALEKLSHGETDISFRSMIKDTEIGKIAKVSNVFRDSLLHNLEMAEKQKTFLADQQAMGDKQSLLIKEQQDMAEQQRKTSDIAAEHRKQTDLFQREMHDVFEAAIAGDFSNRISGSYKDSDLASFTLSVNSLIEGVDKGVAETSRVISSLSHSNLAERMEGEFQGTFAELKNSVNDALTTLSSVIETVSESASRITTDTSEISQASRQLAHRTETQAETLGQTSTALNQLTLSVNSVAQGAQDANAVVSDAKNYAKESGQVVVEAINAMSAIKESSTKISKIISVIDDIAFQTNLLALNAGVEAARAGEAGRGFAVVASEVRGLAQRSSEAAREIGVLINNSGDEVSKGVALVDRAGDSLKKISTSVASISSHVETVAISASEQAAGLSEINTAIGQLDEVTQQNVAMFEETTASTQNLGQEADALFNTVSKFKTDLEEDRIEQAGAYNHHIQDIGLAS